MLPILEQQGADLDEALGQAAVGGVAAREVGVVGDALEAGARPQEDAAEVHRQRQLGPGPQAVAADRRAATEGGDAAGAEQLAVAQPEAAELGAVGEVEGELAVDAAERPSREADQRRRVGLPAEHGQRLHELRRAASGGAEALERHVADLVEPGLGAQVEEAVAAVVAQVQLAERVLLLAPLLLEELRVDQGVAGQRQVEVEPPALAEVEAVPQAAAVAAVAVAADQPAVAVAVGAVVVQEEQVPAAAVVRRAQAELGAEGQAAAAAVAGQQPPAGAGVLVEGVASAQVELDGLAVALVGAELDLVQAEQAVTFAVAKAGGRQRGQPVAEDRQPAALGLPQVGVAVGGAAQAVDDQGVVRLMGVASAEGGVAGLQAAIRELGDVGGDHAQRPAVGAIAVRQHQVGLIEPGPAFGDLVDQLVTAQPQLGGVQLDVARHHRRAQQRDRLLRQAERAHQAVGPQGGQRPRRRRRRRRDALHPLLHRRAVARQGAVAEAVQAQLQHLGAEVEHLTPLRRVLRVGLEQGAGDAAEAVDHLVPVLGRLEGLPLGLQLLFGGGLLRRGEQREQQEEGVQGWSSSVARRPLPVS